MHTPGLTGNRRFLWTMLPHGDTFFSLGLVENRVSDTKDETCSSEDVDEIILTTKILDGLVIVAFENIEAGKSPTHG